MAANQVVTVLEADGVTSTDVEVLGTGRQAATASKSVALSTEDKTALDAAVTALQLLDNAIAGNEMQVDLVGSIPAGTANIGDVDVLTVITGTGATNLGKAADAVAGATDTGVAVYAIRDDVLTTLTPADGDYAPLRVNSTGALHVTGGGGGTEYTEDAAAASDPVGQMMMAVRRDTLSASEVSADGDNVALKATSKGQLHTFMDASQVIATGTAGTPASAVVTVQGITNGTPQPISNTPLTNFGAGEYELVAAGSSTQALGATGAAGDYLAGVLIVPETTGAGTVAIKDGSNTAINIFVTGTLSNLVPFFVPLGIISTSGAWQITTGTNVHAIGVGNFT